MDQLGEEVLCTPLPERSVMLAEIMKCVPRLGRGHGFMKRYGKQACRGCIEAGKESHIISADERAAIAAQYLPRSYR